MPNNDLILDQVETNPHGFIITDKTLMTSKPGLFVAGDVRAGSTKQIASAAAGEGATAALMIREYLKEVG
jgi:thioredoxin reductase (NADPH)